MYYHKLDKNIGYGSILRTDDIEISGNFLFKREENKVNEIKIYLSMYDMLTFT